MPDAAASPATASASAAAPAAAPAPAAAAPVAAAAEPAKPEVKAGDKPTEKAADPAKDKADFDKQWAEFKAPEGYDKAALKQIVDFAREAGIPPAAAAKLAMREKARVEQEAANFKHMAEKGWLEELQKDPDLGGEKSRETMVNVMRAHDRMDPKVQALIKEHGVLYNPVVARILHDLGSKMKEDTFVRPGTSAPADKKQTPYEKLVGMFEPKK
jgi:hypothetical protein